MKTKDPTFWNKICICLWNLNFLGLGYLLTKQKRRWQIAIGANFIILVMAYFLNASKLPWLWGTLFLLDFAAMAVDLWFILKKDETNLAGLFKNNITILLIATLAVNVLFGAGFFLYRWMGENLYQQGELAYQKNDLKAAFENFYSVSYLYRHSLNSSVLDAQDVMGEVSLIIDSQNRVQAGDYVAASEMVEKFEELYPDSPKIAKVKNIGIDAYIGAAKQLTDSADYEGSLEKIETVKKILPVQAEERKAEIDEVLAANYLAWGESAYQQQNYEISIEKFEIVTSEFVETVSLEDAYAGAALSHFDYATELEESQQYDLSWEHYSLVLENYRDSEEYPLAVTQVASMLFDWGKNLASQDHFLLALEKFDLIAEYSDESTLLAQADEEKETTILLLANDSGEDGQSVLFDAKFHACAGEVVTDPSVGIFEDETKKALACSTYSVTIPEDLIADKPGNLYYVIDRYDDERRVQSCDYVTSYDRRTLERWQNYSEIIITDVRTGETVYDKTFYGSSPESCPNEYWFGSMTEYLYGDYVDEDKITTWLDEVLQ